jgi:small subunit ribosomal protein S6
MALYEVVSVARQDLTAEDVDGLTEKLSKIITDNKGEVISKEYWGLRNLPFPIHKNSRGHYVLLNISAPHDVVSELKRVMGFNEDIIRDAIYSANEHKGPSQLAVSVDAKDYKSGKLTTQNPSEFDVEIEKIVINNI